MDPTLAHGQYLIVNKLSYAKIDPQRLSRIVPIWKQSESASQFAAALPQRGEIIVFEYPLNPERDFVKRVIGIPGDTIIIASGSVFLNGKVLNEDYVTSITPQGSLWFADNIKPDITILKDLEYFVLGDNRMGSNDSRNWGPVHEDHIHGKVWAIYWPFDKIGILR
jgi:signal peptidase I